MDSIVNVQKEAIFVYKVQNENNESIRHLMNKTVFNLNVMLKESEDEVERQKRLKWIAIIGGGAITAIAIIR